jgi:hypothetical protein
VGIKDSCWSMRTVYGPIGLLGVSTTGPRLDWVLQPPLEDHLSR